MSPGLSVPNLWSGDANARLVGCEQHLLRAVTPTHSGSTNARGPVEGQALSSRASGKELTQERCCCTSRSSLHGFQASSSFEQPEFFSTAWPVVCTAHNVGTGGGDLGWGWPSALGASLVSSTHDPAPPQGGPQGRGSRCIRHTRLDKYTTSSKPDFMVKGE